MKNNIVIIILKPSFMENLSKSGILKLGIIGFKSSAVTSIFLILLISISLASFHPTFAAPVLEISELDVEEVTSGLSAPVTMDFLGQNDFLVLQKNNGQVRRVVNDVLQPNPVLDLSVTSNSERGLLGIEILHTDPPTVYLFFTESSSDGGSPLGNRIYKYTWDALNSQLINPILVKDLPVLPGPNHNGGILVADVNDNVFAINGDLNRDGILQNFPTGNPDDTSVIIPIDPAGTYVAMGIRNSFGFSIDPVTQFFWDTENGPGTNDEVNLITQNFNSGWQTIMGHSSQNPNSIPQSVIIPGHGTYTYSDPEFTWFDTICPTAIAFVQSIPLSILGDYALVGDCNNGQLYRFPLNPSRTAFDFSDFPSLQDLIADDNTERDLLRIGFGFGSITDIKVGPDGLLYIVSFTDGAIYRIYPVDTDDTDGDGVPDDMDQCPGFDDNLDADDDEIPDACDPNTEITTNTVAIDTTFGGDLTVDGASFTIPSGITVNFDFINNKIIIKNPGGKILIQFGGKIT